MKRYLGDGVYVEFDGYQIQLTTSDGESTTNEIFLEPGVRAELESWLREHDAEQAKL